MTRCGRLFTWGHGRSGRLGHGNEEVCMLPTEVQGLNHKMVTDVAASETHSAALTRDGELYTWGRDRFGQVNCLIGRPSIARFETFLKDYRTVVECNLQFTGSMFFCHYNFAITLLSPHYLMTYHLRQ